MKLNTTFFMKCMNPQRRVTLCVWALVCCIGLQTTSAQSVVEKYGRLQVNGSYVTAENGDKISLAGNSLFWSNAGDVSDFYNALTVNHLADDWKSAFVRIAIGVKETWDNGTGYIDSPTAQTAKVRTVIDAAIAKGIYVIIDWHTHAAELYKPQAVSFFTEMAELYGDNDHIIYEIFNEPINQPWSDIKSYAADVIAGIRSKDPDNLIIVGTPEFDQQVGLAAASPITGDPNLAYTMHFYADSHGQFLRDRTLQAMNDGIALFVTEFGTTHFSGNGGYNPTESQIWLDFLNENHISYVNWNVSDKDEDSSIVNPNRGAQGLLNGELTASGQFMRNHMRARFQVLSVDDFVINGEKIKIVPNPVQDILSVISKFSIDAINIYDLTGRVVLSKEVATINPALDIQSLSAGNYMLQLTADGKSAVTKITKF